jgi:uncharacterized protein YbaP (TraB family)
MIQRFVLCILFCATSILLHAQKTQQSILWEIKKTPNSKPSYLFGTFHISSKGVFRLGDSFFNAIANVDLVGNEVNQLTWQREEFDYLDMTYSYNAYNNNITSNYIRENSFKKTNTIQKLPLFIAFQPPIINYFLYRSTQNEGFEEEVFLDRFVASTGAKMNKQLVGLENYLVSERRSMEGKNDMALEEKKENLELPDGLSQEQIAALIYDAYKNQDLDLMDSLMAFENKSTAYNKKFLIQRNYDQADSIMFYINSGKTLFAAVGAAHLPGKEGLITILRKNGYTLRPVKLEGHAKEKIENIKKIIKPFKMESFDIDGALTGYAPGPMRIYNSTSLAKVYSNIDMINGGFFMITRIINNGFVYNKKDIDIVSSIDSLLYENIEGNILSKEKITYQGYKCIDVLSKKNNKDIERYRFIVTPYEIIKLKVGGKNQYAQLPIVDSFFNLLKINLSPNTILPEYGMQVDDNKNWHVWTSELFGRVNSRIKFSKYIAETKNTLGCIKLNLGRSFTLKDSVYYKSVIESFAGSSAVLKEDYEHLNYSILTPNHIQKLRLQYGGEAYIKVLVDKPFVYLLYSVAETKADTSWMDNVKSKNVTYTNYFNFADSLKGIALKIPVEYKFDAGWKREKERNTNKPDKIENPNVDEILEFKLNNIYSHSADYFNITDPKSMDAVAINTLTFDSCEYYNNSSYFWKTIVDQDLINTSKTSGDFDADVDVSNLQSIKNLIGNLKGLKNLDSVAKFQIANQEFDTTKLNYQKVSYVILDSLTHNAVSKVYVLHHNRLYRFSAPVNYTTLKNCELFNQVISGFKPYQVDSSFNIFKGKLQDLTNKYLNAELKDKPIYLWLICQL